MREEVFEVHRYQVGHRVDKQLLLSLENIFMQYNEQSVLEIRIKCSNNMRYIFQSVEECVEYFCTKPYRIVVLEIAAILGIGYDSNKITITFDNRELASTEIRFQFSNNDDYLSMKNNLELCLNNFKLNYRILSRVPMIPLLLTMVLVIICVYTNTENIVFDVWVQHLIVYIWIGGSILALMCLPLKKLKRNLFPCTEFRIGQNELVERRNEIKRNFIVGTVFIGVFLGVIVNFISNLLM